MKEKIIHLLGGVSYQQYEVLEAKLLNADIELTIFRNQKLKERPLLDVTIGDPIPDDIKKRKMYVAQVAGFHKDYLSPKIRQIITTLRGEFEKVNRNTFSLTQDEYDLYLKGAINFGWLLDEWGEVMINEQIANQQGISEEETEILKDKLN